jgi:hypothetical protein
MEERAKQVPVEPSPIPVTSGVGRPSGLENLARLAELNAILRLTQDKAKADILNDLIAGRLVGFGRPSESYDFERIDASYWIGAKVDWGGSASRDSRTFIEVRIVMPDAIAPIQPKPQPGPGRPSKAEVIRAAIDEYAKSDSALDRPRSERYRAYRSYISSKGFKRVRDAGFSDKTFEKYEREFRNKFK